MKNNERTIAVIYYRFKRVVKEVKYLHLENACGRCFTCMDRNRYEATVAEVVDLITGEIYLTVYLTVDGNVHSFYGKGAKDKIRAHKRVLKQRKDDQSE